MATSPRVDLDPREIKQIFREAWERSDSRGGFTAALEERGYYLARGDRRGFVAVDLAGQVYSVARYTGIKTKEVNTRLGNPRNLPSVEETKYGNAKQFRQKLRKQVKESREKQAEERKPLEQQRALLLNEQRAARSDLKTYQEKRWQAETRLRAGRMRDGWRGAIDHLTGRARLIRKQNETETYRSYLRDREEREALYARQFDERADVTNRIAAMRAGHRAQRQIHIENVALILKLGRRNKVANSRTRSPQRGPEFTL